MSQCTCYMKIIDIIIKKGSRIVLNGLGFFFICSSDESLDSNSSSIVFQSLSQAQTDPVPSAKEPQGDLQPLRAVVPACEGQVVCPKTMRLIPENYVPCVFLGKGHPSHTSRCPAMGWDSSALLEENSKSSINNNNSCTDKDCQQRTDKRATKPSQEVDA